MKLRLQLPEHGGDRETKGLQLDASNVPVIPMSNKDDEWIRSRINRDLRIHMGSNNFSTRLLGKGSGAHGVYLFTDSKTGQESAIKVFRKLSALEKREIHVHEKMATPDNHLMQAKRIGCVTPHGFCAIQMEVCTDLQTWAVRQKTLDLGDASRWLHWMLDALCGLEALHSRGWKHMDIRPENMLLDSKNRIRISDFGLTSNRSIMTLKDLGTPMYIPPDILNATTRSRDAKLLVQGSYDIYCLGLSMIQVLFQAAFGLPWRHMLPLSAFPFAAHFGGEDNDNNNENRIFASQHSNLNAYAKTVHMWSSLMSGTKSWTFMVKTCVLDFDIQQEILKKKTPSWVKNLFLVLASMVHPSPKARPTLDDCRHMILFCMRKHKQIKNGS